MWNKYLSKRIKFQILEQAEYYLRDSFFRIQPCEIEANQVHLSFRIVDAIDLLIWVEIQTRENERAQSSTPQADN